MPLLNQYDIERYIKVAADRGDLSITWEDKEQPRTDGRTVFLPKLTAKTTEDQAKRLMWFTTHEASHNVYTDFGLINEKHLDVTKSELAALFNQLEDDNIDYINGHQFKGDRELCADQASKMLPDLLEKARESKAKGNDVKIGQDKWDNLMAMLAFECDFRSDYCYGTSHLIDGFKDLINNKADSKVDKLLSGPYKQQLRELREDHSKGRSRRTYELAKQIFEEIMGGDAAKEEERLQELAKQAGSGKEGKGSGSGTGKGNGSKAEGNEKGDGTGPGEGREPGYSDEIQDVDYSEWSSDPSEFIRHEEMGAGQRVHYDQYIASDRNYQPCPYRETYVVDYDRGTSNCSKIRPMDESGGRVGNHYEEEYRKLATTSSDGFANRVRMLLQIRSKGKTQYGTKRGVIHPANLYRTTIKDAPGYNERVFKKRIVSDVLDTAVQIIVDGSGSMMGSKYAHAITAGIHLSDTLGNILHMPIEVLGFTEFGARNCMFVFRNFDNKLLSKEKLLQRMVHAGRFSNQNADGDAVLFGYNRIIQRKEKRKVMIVLSDGSPAGDRKGDLPAFTKAVVAEIEKGKKVEIIGIGVMDNNVIRYYKDNQVINKPQEIEPALLKLIQRKVV